MTIDINTQSQVDFVNLVRWAEAYEEFQELYNSMLRNHREYLKAHRHYSLGMLSYEQLVIHKKAWTLSVQQFSKYVTKYPGVRI